MKKVIYAQLYKPYDYERGGFTPLEKASVRIGRGVAGTIVARYCKGISANNDNMIIEVTDEEVHRD